MSFISPMMAKPLPEGFQPSEDWIAEEKFDGHRIVVSVSDAPADLFGGRSVTAWSRYGIERSLPPHIRDEMAQVPTGTYDGELLVPGERSYGTVVIENSPKLQYIVFDVMELLGKDVTLVPWLDRRAYLNQIFTKCLNSNHNGDADGIANDRGCGNPGCFKFNGNETVRGVSLATVTPIRTVDDIKMLTVDIWSRDGEGLILKNINSLYVPAKRPKNTWYKIKQLRSEVLTVVGFRQGTMGPNSVVVLRDDSGIETTVKWKNYEELDKIQANPNSFLGKKLRIEFQERTADGSYRHPRWDRWEDE